MQKNLIWLFMSVVIAILIAKVFLLPGITGKELGKANAVLSAVAR